MPKFCTNVTVDDVKVYNHYVQGHNTDGVNPYGSKNVSITNTVIVTGDDCIAVKSGPRPSCGIPSEDIVVYNVTCVGSHGLTIGSEMNAGVRNVHFANITIDGRNTPSSQVCVCALLCPTPAQCCCLAVFRAASLSDLPCFGC